MKINYNYKNNWFVIITSQELNLIHVNNQNSKVLTFGLFDYKLTIYN